MNKRLALLLALIASTHSFAQHAASSLPPNYKTILETQAFRIIRVHYGPHEKVPVHDHPDTPTVYVYLNNSGPVRIIHEEEAKPFTLVRPPTHTGAFRISPGRVERHSIENTSDLDSDFLRVELLNLRLGDDTLEFRGQAPTGLSHNLSATEFSVPKLSIARTICVEKAPCSIPVSSETSVIVALSNATINSNGHITTLHLGDVMAISPQQSLTVTPTGNEPAQLLQVLVPAQTSKQ